jgi:phosphatidylglycerol:prolipoprotein diacylglycerol transferase
VLGARLAFILQELPYYRQNLGELFSLQFKGLTSYGGFVAGFVVLWIYARKQARPLSALLDTFAAPFLLANAIGRVGCLLNGCCFGPRCGPPWGVHVEGSPGLHQPAQLYESLMNLLGLWILLRLERKGLKQGQSIGAMFVLFGVGRFIYEFWRAGLSSSYLGSLPITDAQLVAALVAIGGALAYRRFGYSAGSPSEAREPEPPSI